MIIRPNYMLILPKIMIAPLITSSCGTSVRARRTSVLQALIWLFAKSVHTSTFHNTINIFYDIMQILHVVQACFYQFYFLILQY